MPVLRLENKSRHKSRRPPNETPWSDERPRPSECGQESTGNSKRQTNSRSLVKHNHCPCVRKWAKTPGLLPPVSARCRANEPVFVVPTFDFVRLVSLVTDGHFTLTFSPANSLPIGPRPALGSRSDVHAGGPARILRGAGRRQLGARRCGRIVHRRCDGCSRSIDVAPLAARE